MKSSHTWQHRGLFLVIVLIGFALRLYRLGAQSLWYDETVSAHLARQDIVNLVAHTAGDIHPPGYYVLLHFWGSVVGDSEFALAFFSVIFGVLLISLTYAVAQHLFGRQVALWAALLVAISPYNLWYSQEVRMYTLGAALGLMSLWCALSMLVAAIPPATEVAAGGPSPCARLCPPFGGRNRGLPLAGRRPTPTGVCNAREGRRPARSAPPPRFQSLAAAIGYALFSAIGLYVLYYYAFLLIVLNVFALAFLVRWRALAALRVWLLAQVAVLVLYIPWLPVAWRQVTDPPVPPWRSFVSLPGVLVETWTALALGQSVRPEQVWPLLVGVGVIFVLGVYAGWHMALPAAAGLLVLYTLGPLLLIYLVSLSIPLYHVRYIFTYAPPFYILVAAGLIWLAGRARLLSLVAVSAVLAGSALSIYQLHTDPQYAADDLRGAVSFIAQRWRPGDAIFINAGYAYTAFMYYYRDPIAGRLRLVEYRSSPSGEQYPLVLQSGIIDGDPDLGWGGPSSDFYATTEAETTAALSRVIQAFPRLWVLRIYDTVADQRGVVRAWLLAHTIPFEDRTFAGQSFVHVQGFMSRQPPAPPPGAAVQLQGDAALAGWQVPSTVSPGVPLDVVLWWRVTGASPAKLSPYAVSLKLWGQKDGETAERLAAQQDEWPVGNLLFTPRWPLGEALRYPMRLHLPPDLAPGTYRLDVEMYDTVTLQPLQRQDGQGSRISLGLVTVNGKRGGVVVE